MYSTDDAITFRKAYANFYKITFKIKTRFYLELLTPETIELLGSTKNKTTKYKHVPQSKLSISPL